MAKNLPPHLRRLPARLADRLTPEAKRELADSHTRHERDRRERDVKGWANTSAGVPPFLEAVEAVAPRAADLYHALPPRSSRAEVVAICRERFGMAEAAAIAALDALLRAELVTGGPDGYTAQSPGNVPF